MPSVYLPGLQLGRDELLLRLDAEEVVDVVQLLVLDEQRVAAEARTVREDHAGAVGVGDLDVGEDLVRPAAHVDGHAFRNRGRVRDSRCTARGAASSDGPLDGEDFHCGAIVKRQHQVLLRLLEPGLDQRLQFLGVFLGQVLRLGAIDVHVVEFPLVLVEVALAGERGACRATTFQPSSQMPRVPSIA